MRAQYQDLLRLLRSGQEAVLLTRHSSHGAGLELFPAGSAECSVRESDLRRACGPCLENAGDSLTLAELFFPKPRCLIFGGGHVALPLASMASGLNFETLVYDDRPSFASKERFPQADTVICDAFERLGQRLTPRAGDYAVIVTRGHRHDQLCLRELLRALSPPSYTGMIGSRRRAAIVLRQLEEEGLPAELLRRVHSPIGLDISAVTPEEIALSIAAELVQERRRRDRSEPADMALLEWLAGEEREAAALVTVLSSSGPTPRKAGAKMAVLQDGRSLGSIGGGLRAWI